MASHKLSDDRIITSGELAEIEAQHFLERHGLTLREKNFITYGINGKKSGEIDLIMQDKHEFVFVEVKMRSCENYGVLESITKSKQSAIIRAAKSYLVQKNMYNAAACRFDAIGIVPDKNNPLLREITWIKHAFEVQY